MGTSNVSCIPVHNDRDEEHSLVSLLLSLVRTNQHHGNSFLSPFRSFLFVRTEKIREMRPPGTYQNTSELAFIVRG